MKVAIIGDGSIGKTAIENLKESNVDVIMVGDSPTDVQNLKDSNVDVIVVGDLKKTFELNGETYTLINPNKPINTLRDSVIASLASMDNMYAYGESYYERKLSPNIDIIKEYELIKLKKSNLSKWERDMVVHQFEKTYKLIK